MSEASGLRLEVIGATLEEPDPERTARELRNGRPGAGRAPVLFAWTTPDVVPRLEGTVAGVGGPVTQLGNRRTTRYIGGSVYLDGPHSPGHCAATTDMLLRAPSSCTSWPTSSASTTSRTRARSWRRR